MDDLISRTAAIDRINKQREHLRPDIFPQDKIGDAAYRICAEFIERLPTAQPDLSGYSSRLWKAAYERGKAEAQPDIIHCGECKYYHDSDGCFFSTATTGADGFCHWAERKEGEE